MNREDVHIKALFESWDAVLKHRRRFVRWGFLGAMAVLAVGLALPKKYKAKATFERQVDLVMTQMVTRGAPESQPNPKKTIAQEIAGQPAIDGLIDQLIASDGLPGANANDRRSTEKDPDDKDAEELRNTLARRVVVKHDIATPRTNRVSLEFVDGDPVFAQRVVNGLVGNYLRHSRADIADRLNQTAQFYEQEALRCRGAIESLEDQRLAFEMEHAAVLPQSGDVQAMLTAAAQKKSELQQEHAATALRVEALDQQITQTPQQRPVLVTAPNPKRAQMQQQLAKLNEDLRTLRDRMMMTEKHPELVGLVEQIRNLEAELEQTPQDIVIEKHVSQNDLRQTLELQRSDAVASLASLESKAALVDEEILRLNHQAAQVLPIRSAHRKLVRDCDQARRDLDFWEDNLRRVRMAQTAELGDRGVQLTFLKPCRELTKPVSPRLSHVLAVAIGVGLLAGGVGVYEAWCRDDSFTDARDLAQRLELAVLGTIGELVSAKQRWSRRLRAALLVPVQGASMSAAAALLVGLLYLNLEKPMLWRSLTQDPAGFLHGRSVQSDVPTPHRSRDQE